jgi:GTP cyclohydrolase I
MNKHYITWEQVFQSLEKIDLPENIIYGIPNGGMILCAFLNHATITHKPIEANIILDDIIDSGKTMGDYKARFPGKQYYSIINKLDSKNDYTFYKNKWIVFPWEMEHPGKTEESIQGNITRQLQFIGEDIKREGLLQTPNRVVKMWSEIFKGYNQKPEDILTTFDADGYADQYDEIVLLKDCELYSMCEHHMMPFFGKIHIAYIPDKKVVGISKLARLADIFAKRMQIQERLTNQVTQALMDYLKPKGAACIIEATHMCMRMRGVEKQNSCMTTSSMKGVFLTKPEARQELMQLIKK